MRLLMSHGNFTIGHSSFDVLRFIAARNDRRTVTIFSIL